jgi:competence protein ComEC
VTDDAAWIKQKALFSFSLVEWRISAKLAFKRMLARYLPAGQTRSFLEGVLIGEFHDSLLSQNLSRFGLQHITVVSGFHFSLMVAILGTLFRLFLSWRQATVCLLLASSIYLAFVGASPSVLRAYLAIALVLVAKLIGEKTNGINCLGLGLVVCIALEPTWVTNLSFSLSFLATWAILLFYPLLYSYLLSLFPRRSGSTLLQMTFFDQLAFVLLAFFRTSVALVLAVSLLMLPASLYFFQQFPMIGIVYNCFFPFFITLAVSILALGMLFYWVTPIAAFFFHLAAMVTECALTHVTDGPLFLDSMLRSPEIPALLFVFYLSAVSFIAILFGGESGSRRLS